MSGKSIWAIAAGVIFIIVVSTLADALFHAIGVYPAWNEPIDDKLALLATSYRTVISVAGAWLTARLAPSKPMEQHHDPRLRRHGDGYDRRHRHLEHGDGTAVVPDRARGIGGAAM